MIKRLPTRRQVIGTSGAAFVMWALLQAWAGSDQRLFWSSLLISTSAVAILWGYRRYATAARGPYPDTSIYGGISRVVFWVVVTLTLFLAYPAFE